jgi:uncharacterized membrane protein
VGLTILIGVHIACGLAAVICGATAMLAPKQPGRHPRFGRIYLAALSAAVVSGTGIALTDWTHLWQLLPPVTFWFLPAVAATPLVVRALYRRRTQRH